MVNKREKTRSLVYQMKEDIFHQEAALAEIKEEKVTVEKLSENKIVPLPKFCHHSTGTVYDHPEGILRMAQLFEERGQLMDRKSLSMSSQKSSTPLHSKTRLVSDVSPTRLRRNRPNIRPTQVDLDGLALSPTASRSPIQQLFRDKMEGLESASWAASLEVKTDSTSDGPFEASSETSLMPHITSGKLDAVLSSFTPSCNGFVKALNVTDDQKHSISRPANDESKKNKSVGIERTPSPDVIDTDASAVVLSDAAATDLHLTPNTDVNKTDQVSSDHQLVTSQSDKVNTSRESDRIKVEMDNSDKLDTAKVKAPKSKGRSADKKSLVHASRANNWMKVETDDSDKLEASKVKAPKSKGRLADKKSLVTAKKDELKESPVSEKDADAEPQIQTRRRVSKGQSSCMTDKSNLSVTQISNVPSKSARKTRSSDQLVDSNDILTKRAPASKSENLKRTHSSSNYRPSDEKLKGNDKASTRRALLSKTDTCLQQELSNDEQQKETTGRGQQVPLQDSSALNQDTLRESIPQRTDSRNIESTDSASLIGHVPSDSETSNRPYFHCDNFRPVEVDSSKTDHDEDRCTTGLHSVKYEASHSQGSVSLEPTHRDDAVSLSDTQVVDFDSTSGLKLVNSTEHKESEKSSDDSCNNLLSKTLVSKPENVEKLPSSASKSRPKTRPGVCRSDAAKGLFDVIEKDDVPKDDDIKKSASRQRRKINSVNMEDVEEISKFHAVNQADEDVTRDRNSSASRDTMQINSISTDAVSVEEISKRYAVYQTGKDATLHRNLSLMPDSKEVATSDMSANKAATEQTASVGSESPAACIASDNHVELTSSVALFADISVRAVTDQGMSGVVDVDHHLQTPTGLKSTVVDSLATDGNLSPILGKLYVDTENLNCTKPSLHNDSTGSTSSVKDGLKSGPIGVGSQPSELGKVPTASSRKRAAHLMAGCHHRTVGVKRPPPIVEKTVPNRHTEIDVNDVSDWRSPSEHRTFNQTDLDIESSVSDKYTQPHTPKHVPFAQTDSNISRSAETLTESSNHFFRDTPLSGVNAKYVSRLSCSSTGDISEEVANVKRTPQNLPSMVEDSLWKYDTSHWYDRPQLMRYDSVGSPFSGSLLNSTEPKTLTSPTVSVDSKDSRREAIRADLLRKFLPSQLVISDSIKRRVQDGLQRLSSVRSTSTICSHTRQKLVDYLDQSRKETAHARLPLRPIDDKHDHSAASLRRRMPARPRRRIYSEWEYISGDELTSPVSDAESNSDSDYSVDFEELAMSEDSVKSSRSLVRT